MISTPFDPGSRLIVALDFSRTIDAVKLACEVRQSARLFKVGLELFTASPEAIETLTSFSTLKDPSSPGIMLDLKLCDIPETVGRAARVLTAYPRVELITVHTSGGPKMLEAAVASGARVLAVTVLTSMDADTLRAVGYTGAVEDLVLRRALLARSTGCAGVVASPREAAMIRAACPPPFLIVTPGIRAAGATSDDQKRVATARQAVEGGADLVVVGRPIRDAEDPRSAAAAFVEELKGSST